MKHQQQNGWLGPNLNAANRMPSIFSGSFVVAVPLILEVFAFVSFVSHVYTTYITNCIIHGRTGILPYF
jgi:hypothetical protein